MRSGYLIFILSFLISPLVIAKDSCETCDQAKRLLVEAQKAHKEFSAIKNPMAKPPTQEEKTWHIATQLASEYVCNFDPERVPSKAFKGYVNLVTGVYKLKLDNNSTHEMYLCFHRDFYSHQELFKKAIKDIEKNPYIRKILKEGAPDPQDSAKPYTNSQNGSKP